MVQWWLTRSSFLNNFLHMQKQKNTQNIYAYLSSI